MVSPLGSQRWAAVVATLRPTSQQAFGPPLTESPIDELAVLRHDGTVDEFAKKFMVMSYRNTDITEAHQVQLFLAGLGKPLRMDVALQRSGTLLACAYKQRNARWRAAHPGTFLHVTLRSCPLQWLRYPKQRQEPRRPNRRAPSSA
jgi:hypothetical protein